MKRTLLCLLLLLTTFAFAQKTKRIYNYESAINAISPAANVSSWVFIKNLYGKENILYSEGKVGDYLPQFKGFKFDENDKGFYYIAYQSKDDVAYVQNLDQLKDFIGEVDNVQEAVLTAYFKGYLLDTEYTELASQYEKKDGNYILYLSKITSEKCPFQKSLCTISVQPGTGKIVNEEIGAAYQNVYDKTCKNNPHYEALKKTMDEVAEEKKKKAEQRSAYYKDWYED